MVVDLLAPLERFGPLRRIIPVGDETGMIDVAFVGCRRSRCHERGIGPQLVGTVAAAAADLGEVFHKIQKLLPIGEQVDEACGHERHRRLRPRLDVAAGDRDLPARIGRVAQHDSLRRFADDDARHALPFLREDRHRPILWSDRLRRLEKRLDHVLGQ